MEWDLSIIYKNDKSAREKLQILEKNAKEFAQKYQGKLGEVADITVPVKELENISEELGKLEAYAYLKFAKNSEFGGFLHEISSKCTEIASNLVFFDIEFCSLENASELANGAKNYKYLLNNWLLEKKYQLDTKSEQVYMQMRTNGSEAFSRFFDEYLSSIEFKLDLEKISEEELLSKMQSSDRALRKRAADALTKGLKKHIKPLVFVFNQIKNSHATTCKLRGYEHAMKARNISNQISDESVEKLIEVCENNFDLVEKFYLKKREILGLKQLKDYDRYAPLDACEKEYAFDESCKIVKEVFKNFNPKFAKLMQQALDAKALDVNPGKNKRGGAFSYGLNPQPFVMLNHTNKQRDVFTLAHELGHLIHQSLAAQKQSYFYMHTPLTTAETASVFAEMLLYDYLKNTLDEKEKKALLASKIEDIFATLFRQINFTTFERELHNHEGELSVDEICDIWYEQGQKMFGKSVKLRKKYKYWFSYIPHFIHSPFYCYSYSYAQLLVLALFGLYKSGKCENFVEIYEEFLASGSSKSPKELCQAFNLDIDSAEFWELGIEQIKAMVEEFCE